jgi:Helix-turn-helix domain
MGVENPLAPLVRSIVQEVIAELREEPLDQGPQPRLLSVEGAAKYLSRTPSAIRNMISMKKLKPVRLDGRVYLDVQELDRMIEAAKG